MSSGPVRLGTSHAGRTPVAPGHREPVLDDRAGDEAGPRDRYRARPAERAPALVCGPRRWLGAAMTSSALAATRIATLRELLSRHGVAALLVPSADPHLSEYLPARWQGRAWASGFTGSVGTLVVTPTFAGVWVDSRYWTQADRRARGLRHPRMSLPASGSAAHLDWLAENLPEGGVLAVDGDVLGFAAAKALKAAGRQRRATLRTDLRSARRGMGRSPRDCRPPPSCEHLPPFATVTRAREARAAARGNDEERRRTGISSRRSTTSRGS